MAFAVEGFATVAQNYISRGVASNFYQKWTFGSILGALTLGNQKRSELEIGRPDSGEILSGGNISPIERKRLGTVNSYLARVQAYETNNTAYGTTRGSLPDVANKTTRSHSQATQSAMRFNWAHLNTPILIWHEDKIRAGQEGSTEGQKLAMGQIVDEATEIALQDHISKLARDTYDGSPTSQTADLLDSALGYKLAFSATNTYGAVDRTTEPQTRAQVDATITSPDITKLIDNANVTRGLNTKHSGIDLILCGAARYLEFKSQITAGNGMRCLPEGLPAFAKMGVKKELLQKDNVIIAYDPYITDANYVYCFNTKVWKFMVHPQFNFKVSKFVDNTTTGLNKETYDYAYVQTRFMLTCDDPTAQVVYTLIGT